MSICADILDKIISPPFIAPYPSNELSKILMVAELARSFCLYHTTSPRQQGGHAQNEYGKSAEMTVTSLFIPVVTHKKEIIEIPAQSVPVFKAGKALKESILGNEKK